MYTLLDAIQHKDWHAANEAFASMMQQKLADRLADERKNVFESAEDWDKSEVQRVVNEIGVDECKVMLNLNSLQVDSGKVVSFR
jgi:hypothetical protein